MRLPEIWDPYVIYDDDGFVCGISDNAPEDVKKAFEEYQKAREDRWKI